jgi:hypothetical protein
MQRDENAILGFLAATKTIVTSSIYIWLSERTGGKSRLVS